MAILLTTKKEQKMKLRTVHYELMFIRPDGTEDVMDSFFVPMEADLDLELFRICVSLVSTREPLQFKLAEVQNLSRMEIAQGYDCEGERYRVVTRGPCTPDAHPTVHRYRFTEAMFNENPNLRRAVGETIELDGIACTTYSLAYIAKLLELPNPIDMYIDGFGTHLHFEDGSVLTEL